MKVNGAEFDQVEALETLSDNLTVATSSKNIFDMLRKKRQLLDDVQCSALLEINRMLVSWTPSRIDTSGSGAVLRAPGFLIAESVNGDLDDTSLVSQTQRLRNVSNQHPQTPYQ